MDYTIKLETVLIITLFIYQNPKNNSSNMASTLNKY